MAAKLTRLTHKIAIQLLLVAENCTICGSRSRRPVRKLLDTPPYVVLYYGEETWTYTLHLIKNTVWSKDLDRKCPQEDASLVSSGLGTPPVGLADRNNLLSQQLPATGDPLARHTHTDLREITALRWDGSSASCTSHTAWLLCTVHWLFLMLLDPA